MSHPQLIYAWLHSTFSTSFALGALFADTYYHPPVCPVAVLSGGKRGLNSLCAANPHYWCCAVHQTLHQTFFMRVSSWLPAFQVQAFLQTVSCTAGCVACWLLPYNTSLLAALPHNHRWITCPEKPYGLYRLHVFGAVPL